MRHAACTVMSVSLAASMPAAAQQDAAPGDPFINDQSTSQTVQAGDTTVRFFGDAGALYQFETSLNGDKDFSLARAAAGLGAKARINEDLGFTARVNYGLEHFDFEGPFFGAVSTLDDSDPWETVHVVEFGGVLDLDVTDDLNVFGGPIFKFAGESGADWGDAFTGGGLVGGSYRFSSDLVIGGGVGIVSELEDDIRLFPIFIIDWAFADDWRLSSRSLDQATLTSGVELIYDAGTDWELAVGGGNRHSRFRLDDEGVAPDGIGEDEAIPVWFRASWTPDSDIRLSGLVGFVTEGELKLEDDSGDNLEDVDYDTTWFVGLFGRITF